MKPVLCLGDACVDLLIPYADALKAKAQSCSERASVEATVCAGGSVANTACAIARLDVPVRFAGTCGRDAYGFELKRGLESEGVDTALIRMDDVLPTQMVLLVLNEYGERTAFACPAHNGSQHAILPDQLSDTLISEIGWLHVSGMMLRENPAASTQLAFMKKCRNAGLPVSLDVNARVESMGDPFFTRNLIEAKQYASVIFGSAIDEIALLTDQRDAETAASSLASDGTIVVARNGDQGAILYCGSLRHHFPAFPVEVADTVGAGDAFDGAYIASAMRGFDPKESVRKANIAAAICVSRHGARSGPTNAELNSFILRNQRD